jgi:hypothetical protein
MVMMRHASTHRLLLARKTTFIRRVYASANDCWMPVTVSTAAQRGGRHPLLLRPWHPSQESTSGSTSHSDQHGPKRSQVQDPFGNFDVWTYREPSIRRVALATLDASSSGPNPATSRAEPGGHSATLF